MNAYRVVLRWLHSFVNSSYSAMERRHDAVFICSASHLACRSRLSGYPLATASAASCAGAFHARASFIGNLLSLVAYCHRRIIVLSICSPVKNICSIAVYCTSPAFAGAGGARSSGRCTMVHRPTALSGSCCHGAVLVWSGSERLSCYGMLARFGEGSRAGRALVIGPSLLARPGAGTIAGPGARMAWKRPQARTPGKSRPARGAAFLQHDFYTASALAVDVPPPRHLGAAGAGLILCVGWAIPDRLGSWALSRRGHGSHTPRYVHTAPPPIGGAVGREKEAVTWCKQVTASGYYVPIIPGAGPRK